MVKCAFDLSTHWYKPWFSYSLSMVKYAFDIINHGSHVVWLWLSLLLPLVIVVFIVCLWFSIPLTL